MKIGNILKKKERPALPPRRVGASPPMRQAPGTFGRPPPAVPLAEKIRGLSKQGMAEPDIVRELKGRGYSSVEIDRALRDTLKGSVGEPALPIREQPVREVRRPTTFTNEEIERNPLKMPEPPLPPRQYKPAPPYQERTAAKPFPTLGFGKPAGGKEVEELIEVSVAEKWKDVEGKMKGVEGMFADFDSRLKKIEEQLNELKETGQKHDSEVLSKIETYKDSMSELATRMEGMESALKSAMESVLESNRALSEAVRSLKGKER